MYYHNTKQALLAAFSLRGLMCKSFWPAYEQDYKTINRYTTEESSFQDRLTQDGLLRKALRDELGDYEYLVLQFCYAEERERLVEAWKLAVKPVIMARCKLAPRLADQYLFLFAHSKLSNTGIKYQAFDVAEMLGVNKSHVRNSLSTPMRKSVNVARCEDLASQIIDGNGWFISACA